MCKIRSMKFAMKSSGCSVELMECLRVQWNPSIVLIPDGVIGNEHFRPL